MAVPSAPSNAMSKQNDLRRISNECAVDLAWIREASTLTVTSGSVRQSALTHSKMPFGISTGLLCHESDIRRAADEPPSLRCPTDDLPSDGRLDPISVPARGDDDAVIRQADLDPAVDAVDLGRESPSGSRSSSLHSDLAGQTRRA